MSDRWAQRGAEAYKGTTVAGFPNLFLLAGPNTGTGHTSFILTMEAQVEYAIRLLKEMRSRGIAALEVRREAQARFNEELQARMPRTVWSSGCRSWYFDRHGRNTTLWPDLISAQLRALRQFDLPAYECLEALPAQANGGDRVGAGGR